MRRILLILLAVCVAVPVYAQDFVYFKKKAAAGGGGATNYTNDANIMSWWFFEEAATPAADGSANNNDLTWQNTPTQDGTNKVQGSASIDFDAAAFDQVDIADASLSSTFPGKTSTGTLTDYTIGGWVRFDALSGGLMKKGNSGDTMAYDMSLDGTPNFRFRVTSNGFGAGTTVTNTKSLSTGTWYLAVATVASANIYLYVGANGDTTVTAANAGSGEANTYRSAAPFIIGYDGDNAPVSGQFDEWFVFDRVLSQTEVENILKDGLAGER